MERVCIRIQFGTLACDSNAADSSIPMDAINLRAEPDLSPAHVLSESNAIDLGVTALAIPTKAWKGKTVQATNESEYVELIPKVRIELLSNKNLFRGLGRIEIDGVTLRGSRRPMFAEIRTPDGVEFFDFELRNRSKIQDGVVLEFSMKARASGLQDWMLHTVRNLRVTRDWAETEWIPNAVLKLHLRGIETVFDGRTFRGFEYDYEFESPDHSIYRLLDLSSWAIGDSLEANTFWLRNCFAPSLHTFKSQDEFYSTEWYLGSIANPNIFQFQPFQTNMESFTMMTAEKGQLLTIAPQLFHLRSFFEKPRKTEEMLHWHEHCSDLTSHFKSAPIQVLFCSQAGTDTELINLNGAVRDEVSDELHRQAGLRRERITSYGVIEEWNKPDLKDYTERILPQFLELGIRCIFLPNQFQNNLNMWGVSNMCCTVDYKMPNAKEEAQLTSFCQRAHEGGASVQMWGNTALSSLNMLLRPQDKRSARLVNFIPTENSVFEVLDKALHPYIRTPSGAIEADHYNPCFLCLNLREPAIIDYWHQCWRKAREQIGLDGIFLDSSFNLSSDKFHYSYQDNASEKSATSDNPELLGQTRPDEGSPSAILSMYFAHLQLIAEMQAYGYHYCGEDIGVFGLRRSGPGIDARMNNLFLWSDCYVAFDRDAIRKGNREPDDIFFRGLAYRLMWNVYWNFDRQTLSFRLSRGSDDDDPKPWHRAVLQAYNAAEKRMLQRRVLEADQGIHYRGEDGEILWAFTSFDFSLKPNQYARNLITGESLTGSLLRAEKHGVYEILYRTGPGTDQA
jgi:hypothetical protein